MAFIFTCGTHTFSSRLAGYENVTAQCQHCGNFSAHVYKRWQWFTFCFVPIIPFSLKPWHEVGCGICNFFQDIKFRPDVQNQANGQGGGQIPMNAYGAGGHGPPGPPGSQPYSTAPNPPYQPPPNQSKPTYA